MVIFRSYVSLPEAGIQGNLPAMNITGFFPLDFLKKKVLGKNSIQ